MPLQAVLFDLDGTLVDTERESAEAMARVIQARLGIAVTQDQRDFVVGHSWHEIYARLRADWGAAFTLPLPELLALTAAEREHVLGELGVRQMPGATAAVLRMGERYRRALVTGSSRAEVFQVLGHLGLVEALPIIVASEDYSAGKPSPEGYLKAARLVGVAPTDCLVVEDSAAGITAGRVAGMTVVAVRAGNFLGADQSAAHAILDTLEELTFPFIDELVA